MPLGARQIEALRRLTLMRDGSMSAFDFLGLMDRADDSARSLLDQGYIVGSLATRGRVAITEAGRDVLDPKRRRPGDLL